MSSAAIVLVIISAFMHAGWNLLARRQRSEMAFFGRMLFIVVLLGFVPAVISELLVRSIPGKGWICLVGSGFFAGLYLYSLAMAYGASDFTIVYPVARALPVLLVAFGDIVRGRFLNGAGWWGLVFVAVGCLLTPLDSFLEISPRRYFHRSLLWMLLAAIGTVGYSLLDKVASEVVLAGPATAARYCYIFFFFASVVLLLLRRLTNNKPPKDKGIGWKGPAAGAVCFFGAYWLVLWAYQLSRHASYVVAFRQFSIVIGVVLAFMIYKERRVLVRIVGIALIMVGLILVGIYGG